VAAPRPPCSGPDLLISLICVPMQSLMRERRAAAWRHLNVVERDVLIVVTALCKVGNHSNRGHSAAGAAVLHACTHA
jgi:hypothetical protein